MTGKVVIYKGPGAISFHGRAPQREWLIGFGVNTAIGAVIGGLSSIGPILALPWTVAVLAVTARRLHDLGHSGWLQLAPMALFALALVPYMAPQTLGLTAGGMDMGGAFKHLLDVLLHALDSHSPEPDFSGVSAVDRALMIALAFSLLAYLGFYIWLAGARGTAGPNCYGEVD